MQNFKMPLKTIENFARPTGDYRLVQSESRVVNISKILEQTVMLPGLGSNYITTEIRAEFSEYTEEELFYNST
jgi:hypothetical protein